MNKVILDLSFLLTQAHFAGGDDDFFFFFSKRNFTSNERQRFNVAKLERNKYQSMLLRLCNDVRSQRMSSLDEMG